jgi:hypothetical protein
VTLKKPGDLKSEMGIGRVDELQKDLQNLIALIPREIIMPVRSRFVSKSFFSPHLVNLDGPRGNIHAWEIMITPIIKDYDDRGRKR